MVGAPALALSGELIAAGGLAIEGGIGMVGSSYDKIEVYKSEAANSSEAKVEEKAEYLDENNSGKDISESAENMYGRMNGVGEMLNFKSSANGFTEIEIPAKGGVYENYYYHTVYSDGAYIYDPWYTKNPVRKDIYIKLIKKKNSGNITIEKVE